MIAIVDYGVGNLFSVEKALRAMGADAVVTADEEVLQKAERIVLPGVGAFGDCMKNFQASGLLPVLKDRVAKGCPLLGICVGMQILFDGSEESPGVAGLGWISGRVRRIAALGEKSRIWDGIPCMLQSSTPRTIFLPGLMTRLMFISSTVTPRFRKIRR